MTSNEGPRQSTLSDLRRAWTRFRSRPWGERRALAARLVRLTYDAGLRGALQTVRGQGTAGDEAGQYLTWCARHTPDGEALSEMQTRAGRFPYQPLISIITPVYNTAPGWLEACADSVVTQVYPNWEWRIGNDGSTRPETLAALRRIEARDPRIRVLHAERNEGISAASNLALSAAAGEYVALMDHDDALLPHALFRMVEHLNRSGVKADVLYSDEDKLDLDGGRCDAYFKPDWSPDLFLSSMYVCHLLMLRRSLVEQVGGFRSAFDYSQDYDLMLRVMEQTDRIDHVADILYHWRKVPDSSALAGNAKPTAHDAGRRAIQDHLDRTSTPGAVLDAGPPGLYRVKYALSRRPLVSIIIPTAGGGARHLSETLRTVVNTTEYNSYEVVLVASDPDLPNAMTSQLGRMPLRVERAGQGWNWAAAINRGVAASRGDQLLVLHDDVRPRDATWLEAMLELSEQQGIGAVGAKLYDSRGALQHIGVILGINGAPGRPFQGYSAHTAGYYSGANCIRNYSAVSGACLMSRREVFDSVGGMDETLASEGWDVDYCLRVGAAGYRVVYTPYAELTHHEDGCRPRADEAARDWARLRERWGSRLERDPFYNQHLSLEHLDYRVRVGGGSDHES